MSTSYVISRGSSDPRFDSLLGRSKYKVTFRGDPVDKTRPTPFEVHGVIAEGGYRSRTQWERINGSMVQTLNQIEYAGNAPSYADLKDSPWIGSPRSHSKWGFVERTAVDKLNKRIDEFKANMFNSSVFLAEAGKSVDMVVSAARRVSRGLKALRKGNLRAMYDALGARPPPKYRGGFPGARTVSKDSANYWLEGKYGWLPLLSDAKSAAEKVADMMLEKPDVVRIVSRGNYQEVTKSAYPAPPNTGLVGSLWVADTEITLQYVVTLTVDSQTIALASSLGLTNPLLIAWELVPLSFVADWFLPIGDFLEGISRFHGLGLKHGCMTERHVITSTVERSSLDYSYNMQVVDPYGLIPTQRVKLSACQGRVKYRSVKRSVLTDFPRKHLAFDNQFDWLKGVTAAALIRQFFGK